MKTLTPHPGNVKQETIRVALYARVSTHEQAISGDSVKAQVANMEQYCQRGNYQVTKIYKDEGYSGSNDNRPGYQRLFIDASNHQFDIVMVWRQCRFSRKLRNLANGLETLKELGIRWISASQNLDTSTPTGQMFTYLTGIMAENEHTTTIERTAEAYRIRIGEGRWGTGKPPLGYRWLKAEKRSEIIENEAKVVSLIFDLYANQELGMVQVTQRLNEDHLRDGKLWNFRTIHEILHQSAYMGKHRLGIKFPPIITQELWDKTQTRLKEARKVRRDPRGWLLQGLVTCGECGRTLSCESIWHHNYVCRGRYKDTNRENICTMPRLKRGWLENNVMNELYETLFDNGCIKTAVNNARDELLDRRQSISKSGGDIDAKLEAINGKKERLAIVFADGALSEPAYRKQIAGLKQQEAELVKRRENLDPYTQVEMAEIEQQIQWLTGKSTDDEYDMAWQMQVIDHLYAETRKECNIPTSHRFRSKKEIHAFNDKLVKNEIKFKRDVLRLLHVRIIAYNDRVILRGVLSPRALTVVKDEFQPERVTGNIPEPDMAELRHVFNSPAKTERKTVN